MVLNSEKYAPNNSRFVINLPITCPYMASNFFNARHLSDNCDQVGYGIIQYVWEIENGIQSFPSHLLYDFHEPQSNLSDRSKRRTSLTRLGYSPVWHWPINIYIFLNLWMMFSYPTNSVGHCFGMYTVSLLIRDLNLHEKHSLNQFCYMRFSQKYITLEQATTMKM